MTKPPKRIELEAEQWGEAEKRVDRVLSHAPDDAFVEVYFKHKDGLRLAYRAGNKNAMFPSEVARTIARVKKTLMKLAGDPRQLKRARTDLEVNREMLATLNAPAPEPKSERPDEANPWASDL